MVGQGGPGVTSSLLALLVPDRGGPRVSSSLEAIGIAGPRPDHVWRWELPCVTYSDPYGLSPICIPCIWAGIIDREGFGGFIKRVGSTLANAAFVAGILSPIPGDEALLGARFAQKTYRETFSAAGRFAGKSIDDVAGSLRAGKISPDDVPVDYIVRDGNTLILNTRSAQALERAGIPRSQWKGVNRTGVEEFEDRLSDQLRRNKLGSEGTATVRSTGTR